eukprot:GCRY01002248.1.p1 GENE.GCRY01002248.1~~GCRY01002248.1.p1  ORF type:complete len:820 (-),score=228.25 GCRY01002248.1:259-2718(-)
MCDVSISGQNSNNSLENVFGTIACSIAETYLTPPILTNDILELSLLRGDMIPDNFDINDPLLWDTQRTFYRKGVKNMAMILLHPDKLAFRSIDPLIDGGHLFWMKNNGTVCTDCIYNGTAYDPSREYRYFLAPSFSNEPFNFSKLVFVDTIPMDLMSYQFLRNILSQPQESSGHGRLSWSDVFVKPASDNTIRLTILLGHCVYVTKPCELIVGADMNLDGIGSFVSSIRPSANSRVMILENSGLIVAATNSLVAVYGENGEVIRLQYNQLNDTILKSMGDSILNKFGNFSAVEGQGTLPSVDGITTSFARYTDNFDLKWVVVVGVIEDDFLMESRVKSEHLKEKQNEMSLMLLAYGIIILLVGIIIFEIITYQITSPLKRLKRELAEVAEFKFEEVVPSGDPEESSEAWNTRLQELSSIGHSFDIMRHNMHCFSRYIPPSVVSMIVQGHLNASLGVEPKIVTVFFSDLLNFTTIAESLPPRVLIETLGSYLDEMSRIIMDNEGTVGEFVGDGILAFWNSPYDVANPQGRACQASLMMQQVLAEARAIQNEARQMTGEGGGRPLLRARMGLTAGRVLHGNIGTPDRMKFGIVGDSVNTASRLEALCGFYGVGILVPQQIEKEVRKDYLMRHVDRVIVKGKKRTTDLFELISTHEYSNDEGKKYVELFHEIMDMYWSRKFDQALTHIEEYQKQFPDDVASGIIAQRCEYYLKHPPSRTWNGVYVHMEKEGGGWLEAEGEEKDDPAPTLKAHSPQALVSPTLNMEQQQGKEPLELTETAISDITAAKFPVATPPAQRKDESPELSDPTPVKNHRNLSYLDIE